MNKISSFESSEAPDIIHKYSSYSPDGSILMINSSDNNIRIFPSNDLSASLITIPMSEATYDTSIYPFMNSSDPVSCCFLASSRDHPLRLWDINTGVLRASYITINHVDEITAPNAISFNLDGSRIFCGFNNMLQIFDTSSPGNQCTRVPLVPTKKSNIGLKGIVSTIAFNPDYSGLYALGMFSGKIGLYDERNNELLESKQLDSGITQIKFTHDGTRMITVARKSNEILVWDLRNTGNILLRLARDGNTNQRLQFSIDPSGKYLISGDTNGNVSVYDLESSDTDNLKFQLKCHKDVCSSAIMHPFLPLMATTSGQRYPPKALFNTLDDDNEDERIYESQVCLWNVSQDWKNTE